ncbi:hypothetical protein VNO77_14881 [Canavalia gladiata]|uniref:FAF domain-containing protein n=1 Tax=Canavalia gladiata TaxID=3824 RepID=A0AAN9QVL4_CANGL
MASGSSAGLKDLIISPPTSNIIPIPTPLKTSVSSTASSPFHFDFDFVEDFDKLSVESDVKLSPQSSSFSLLSPLSNFVPQDKVISVENNLGKSKVESEKSNENGSYPKKNLEKEMEDNGKKQISGMKCLPPPISCLGKVKVGKPYKFLAYDKESERYVVEEIKIPNGSLFHASREDGRLKLYMNFLDEE